MSEFTHVYSRKNDGSPSPYSTEQRAIQEALTAFYEAENYLWESFTVTKLPCDDRAGHYPDVCWHYKITINPKEGTDERMADSP